MLLFISGLFLGGFIGVALMSLLAINRYKETTIKSETERRWEH